MLKRFLAAGQFLTILPVRISAEMEEKDWGKSLLYFPIIGALIGAILTALSCLFSCLPILPKGALILAASVILTGGIHLDGFADTCDGFYGGKSKEKILEIMRDSRIGVMGAAGIVILLLLKFSLIVSIPGHFLWRSLIMMTVFGRWAQVLACFVSPYARQEGKAGVFIECAGKKEFIAATAIALLLFLLMGRLSGMIIFGLAAVVVFLCIAWIKGKIGGMTGDTIGAVNETGETAVLLLSLVLKM
ncbi:MAG: adenosylcobinamide-GDP ribazoletransferase [Candidatus Omnitrophota bacterium]